MPDDRTMPPNLMHQLTLAILDHSAGDGLRTIKAIRAYLDTWEAFLQDRQELRNHLLVAHKLNPSCMEADPATLNRRHWEAHDSDLATFMGAHPVQA